MSEQRVNFDIELDKQISSLINYSDHLCIYLHIYRVDYNIVAGTI